MIFIASSAHAEWWHEKPSEVEAHFNLKADTSPFGGVSVLYAKLPDAKVMLHQILIFHSLAIENEKSDVLIPKVTYSPGDPTALLLHTDSKRKSLLHSVLVFDDGKVVVQHYDGIKVAQMLFVQDVMKELYPKKSLKFIYTVIK